LRHVCCASENCLAAEGESVAECQSLLADSWRLDYFSTMIGTVEIKRMSIAERLKAMELLWRSMTGEPDKLESPAWHGKVLAQRLAKVKAGKGEFLTLTQLKQRLAKRTT
jgi:hypothetical protein